jgi:hypothetical protein
MTEPPKGSLHRDNASARSLQPQILNDMFRGDGVGSSRPTSQPARRLVYSPGVVHRCQGYAAPVLRRYSSCTTKTGCKAPLPSRYSLAGRAWRIF